MSRAGAEARIPVVEERVEVGTKQTSERVRVTKTVETREVEVDGRAVKESVEVERVPVGRYVLEVPAPRVDGDVTIIPVVEEIVTVEKRLLLKEEVHIRKKRQVVERKLRVPVRKERVVIERPNGDRQSTTKRKRGGRA